MSGYYSVVSNNSLVNIYQYNKAKVCLMDLREGVKKKIKKSCNIVTTPVRLPTYPIWCTEGNFFMFFACFKKSIFDEKIFFSPW